MNRPNRQYSSHDIHLNLLLAGSLVILFGSTAIAQSDGTSGRHGTVERIKVHGHGLEGNLEGDSPDRDVSVYLPPSYQAEKSRRYPVVYFLHGFTDDDAKWYGLVKHWINLPAVLDAALTNAGSREMIFVTPNAYTRFKGSMYSNSVTTGDWEDYVAKELVAYVDAHYRTIPQPESRGLAGHSMGGYGAMRIGMKHPEIFSSLYLLSPCCMGQSPFATVPMISERLQNVHTFEDVAKADFLTSALLASSAAWAPNPQKPPLYIDLLFENGQPVPLVSAKIAANAPLVVIDQYISYLRQLHAIGFDAGTKDQPIEGTVRTLDKILTSYSIPHAYESYDGDHLNHIADRITTKMVPFFSKNLTFDQPRR